jgi:hypothetical protein
MATIRRIECDETERDRTDHVRIHAVAGRTCFVLSSASTRHGTRPAPRSMVEIPPGSSPEEGRARFALAPAVLILGLLIVASLWILTLGGWQVGASVTGWSDLASYHLPKYQYAVERLASGSLPLWDPYEFAGIPFLASLQPGVFYPPVMFFYSLWSGEPAHVGFFAFHLGVGAIATLVLMRSFGCNLWPSLLASLWVTQPLWLVRIYDHPNFIATICWIPLLLFLVRKCILAPGLRVATTFAVVAGLQFLAGYPPVTFATLYLLLSSLPCWVLEARVAPGVGTLPRAAIALLVAGVVCMLLVGAQLLPTAELAMLTDRGGAAQMAHHDWIAQGDSYSTLFMMGMPQMTFGSAALDFWSRFGPLLIGLCIAAPALSRKSVPAWYLLFAVVLSGLLPFSVYTRMPLYSHVRWALEWHLIAPQMVFALAGFGLQALLSKIRFRPVPSVAATAIAALLSLGWSWRSVETAWLTPPPTQPEAIPDWVVRHCDVYDPAFRAYWPGSQSLGSLFAARVRSVGGYDQSLPPARTSRLIEAAHVGNGFPLSLSAMTTGTARHVISRMALHCVIGGPAPRLRQIGFLPFAPPRSSLKAYVNPSAVPRARLVRNVRFVATPEEALDHLRSAAEETVLEGAPGALPDEGCVERAGLAAITRDEPEEVWLRTDATCTSYLVLADTLLPGWYATVDGMEVPIRAADYAFRAVVVPPGRHEVIFRYEPWTVSVGLMLSRVGVAVALVLLLLPRRLDPLRRFSHATRTSSSGIPGHAG